MTRRAGTLVLAAALVCAGAQAPDQIAIHAPFVKTPPAVVLEMLRLAKVGPGDLVYDLGCGDGRIVIAAARQRGARGVCVDIDADRVEEARRNARAAGVEDRIEFRREDVFETEIARATVVTLYLLADLNLRLRPRLLAGLRPGTRIVSHGFKMGDWAPDEELVVDGSKLYLWRVPAKGRVEPAGAPERD